MPNDGEFYVNNFSISQVRQQVNIDIISILNVIFPRRNMFIQEIFILIRRAYNNIIVIFVVFIFD